MFKDLHETDLFWVIGFPVSILLTLAGTDSLLLLMVTCRTLEKELLEEEDADIRASRFTPFGGFSSHVVSSHYGNPKRTLHKSNRPA